jgi:hypothetical protein
VSAVVLRSIGDIDREADAWGANCGPAAIAAALELQLADVREAVSLRGQFRGYMGVVVAPELVPKRGTGEYAIDWMAQVSK